LVSAAARLFPVRQLTITPLGFEHIVARDRQRVALADILHLVIAGRAALEHHDPPGEVEFPHPEEAGVVHRFDLGPCRRRPGQPVAQSQAIMEPEVLDVAGDQPRLLARLAHLAQRGQVIAREDIFVGEGIGPFRDFAELADRVQQHHPVRLQ
jgi:hypothetical protein